MNNKYNMIDKYLICKNELASKDILYLRIRLDFEVRMSIDKSLNALESGWEFAFFINPELFNSV
jgi:hypothetical protein